MKIGAAEDGFPGEAAVVGPVEQVRDHEILQALRESFRKALKINGLRISGAKTD